MLRFVYAQEIIDIPLVEKFVYLGAVANSGPFEDQTLEHRTQIGVANLWRLGRVLRSRHSLGKSNRLNIWQSCDHPATTCGLTASGLTHTGAKKLTQESLKQIRLAVGDPAYMSHRLHQEVLDKLNLQHPVAELQNRMHQENREAEWHPCVRGPGNAQWQRVKRLSDNTTE